MKQPDNVTHCFEKRNQHDTIYAIVTNKSAFVYNRLAWRTLFFAVNLPEETMYDLNVVHEFAILGDHLGEEVTWGSLREDVQEAVVRHMGNQIYK